MQQLTTYRAQGKEIGLVFLFKYDLNGDLRLFEIVDGVLNDEQKKWLYSGNFPAGESLMTAQWVDNPKVKKIFDIEMSPADISFDALWELYGHKVSKQDAEKAYKKLKEADIIRCFKAIPAYLKYIATKPHMEKLHLSTYINKRRFDDEVLTEPKPAPGKNFNPALKDLAAGKTVK